MSEKLRLSGEVCHWNAASPHPVAGLREITDNPLLQMFSGTAMISGREGNVVTDEVAELIQPVAVFRAVQVIAVVFAIAVLKYKVVMLEIPLYGIVQATSVNRLAAGLHV